jgi:hypothetical protein
MNPTLEQLIEMARNYEPTEEEKRQSAISFAHGNCAIENPRVMREMVEREYDKLHPAPDTKACFPED